MEDSPTYQIILDRGLERGRQEGRAEGRQGLVRAVAALVRWRLGELPEGMEDGLAALDIAALEALHEAVMDAPDQERLRALLPLR